jgi:hypothetical protein
MFARQVPQLLLFSVLALAACQIDKEPTAPTGADASPIPLARPTEPEVVWSPTAIDFGNYPLGTGQPTLDFTLTNSGGAARGLEIQLVQPFPADADFALVPVTNGCGRALKAGASCVVRVRYSPAAANTFSGVQLSATAKNMQAILWAETYGSSYPLPALTLSPAMYLGEDEDNSAGDWRHWMQPGQSTIHFTVTNTGSSPTDAMSLSKFGGGFPDRWSITSNTCSNVTLGSGQSCAFDLSHSTTECGDGEGGTRDFQRFVLARDSDASIVFNHTVIKLCPVT